MGEIISVIDTETITHLKQKYGVIDFILKMNIHGLMCKNYLIQYAQKFGQELQNSLDESTEIGKMKSELAKQGLSPEIILPLLESPEFKKFGEYQKLVQENEKKLKSVNLTDEERQELQEATENLKNELSQLNSALVFSNTEVLKAMFKVNINENTKTLNIEDLTAKIELEQKILQEWLFSSKKTQEQVIELQDNTNSLEFNQVCYLIIVQKENAFDPATKDFFTHILS